MSEMMKAFVMHAIGKVGMIEKPIPRPGPIDAIVRTTAAMICTSDTHTVAGAIGDRHGLTLGHEAVDVIHELGELAAASGLFHIEQHVAVSAITPRYACDNCQRGYPSQCGGCSADGSSRMFKDGSFSEYFHVNNAASASLSARCTTAFLAGEGEWGTEVCLHAPSARMKFEGAHQSLEQAHGRPEKAGKSEHGPKGLRLAPLRRVFASPGRGCGRPPSSGSAC